MLSHKGNFLEIECFLCTNGSLWYHRESLALRIKQAQFKSQHGGFLAMKCWTVYSAYLILNFFSEKGIWLINLVQDALEIVWYSTYHKTGRCPGDNYMKRFCNSQVFKIILQSLNIHIQYIHVITAMFGCQCTGFLIQTN